MTPPSDSILPPGSTALERALESVVTRLLDIPTPLPSLWSATDCPIALLPWLAWALSIDHWSSDWPEEVKRARVAAAIPLARQKGTAESVRALVRSFGGSLALREWWQQSPRGAPYTFALTVNLGGAAVPPTQQFIDSVIAEVNRVKPVSRHFTFSLGLQGGGAIGLVAFARPALYARLAATGE